MTKNYYAEIDKAIISYETHQPYHQHSISWITDRITWCYKWKHISQDQMVSLAERITEVINNQV